jgi:tetratricopeptide (TPR) repeat protein
MFPLVALGQEPTLVQKADNYIYDGNQAFDTSNNVEAEKNYRRATSTGLKKDIAQYNMGTTLQQDNYVVEALSVYADAVEITKERPSKHRNFHNIGNALMQLKEYKGAVEAYKKRLRNNPNDDETRYNYALAKKMLEDEKTKTTKRTTRKIRTIRIIKDNKTNKDQDEKGDKDKDQEGDKDKDKKEALTMRGKTKRTTKRTNLKIKTKGDKEKDQQQPQGNPTQLSPQQVKNLARAMSNEEKKVQDKVNAQKAKPRVLKAKKIGNETAAYLLFSDYGAISYCFCAGRF